MVILPLRAEEADEKVERFQENPKGHVFSGDLYVFVFDVIGIL